MKLLTLLHYVQIIRPIIRQTVLWFIFRNFPFVCWMTGRISNY